MSDNTEQQQDQIVNDETIVEQQQQEETEETTPEVVDQQEEEQPVEEEQQEQPVEEEEQREEETTTTSAPSTTEEEEEEEQKEEEEAVEPTEEKTSETEEDFVIVEQQESITVVSDEETGKSVIQDTITTTTTAIVNTAAITSEDEQVEDAEELEILNNGEEEGLDEMDANEMLESILESVQDVFTQAVMDRLDEMEGFVSYKWKQDASFVYVYLQLIHGETLNAEGAVSFDSKHIRAHTDDVSEEEPGRLIVDLDLSSAINTDECSFSIENDELILKLKKADDNSQWLYLFDAPIKMKIEETADGESSAVFTVLNPPLDTESSSSWFTDLIQPDCIDGHEKFEAKRALFEDKIVGQFTEEVELDEEVAEDITNEQLAELYYQKGMDGKELKLLRKAASLNHVEAKRQCLSIESQLLSDEESSSTIAIMTASNEEEHDAIVKGFAQVKARLEQKKLDYASSLVHTNNDRTALLDLAKIYEQTKDYATAFIYLLEGSLRGSVLCMQHLGTLYYYGSDNFPKDEQKASSWWKMALNRGYAAAAYNLCVLYGGDNDNLDLAQEYFQLANFISGDSFLMPEKVAVKLSRAQEMDPEDLLEAAAQNAFALEEEEEEEGEEEPQLDSTAFTQKQVQRLEKANPFAFNPEEYEEEEEEPEQIVVKDVPGFGWKIAEWGLTFGVLGAIGYAIKRNNQ